MITFSPFAVPTAVTAVLMVAFGASVLSRGPAPVHRAFAAMTAAVAIWMGAFTLVYLARSESAALFWVRVGYAGVPFIAPAVYHFTVEMLQIAERRRAAVAIGWAGAAVTTLMVWSTRLMVSGVDQFWWGWYPRYATPWSFIFLAFFFGYLGAALVEFLRAFPTAHGIEKKRIRYLLIGLVIAYAASVDYMPKYGLDVYPFGYVPILIFVGIVAHTMRSYDLAAVTPSFATREIIGTMADPLFVCDVNGEVRLANPAAERLLESAWSEIAGRPISEFIERRTADEAVIRTKSGELIDMTISEAPITHRRRTVGSVLIGRDVRERKRAEQDARHALTLLQTTLDSTADGILVIGHAGRVLSYNKRFLDMWRIPPEIVESGADDRAIAFVREQLVDPDEFERVINAIYEQPESESFDIIEFQDGRRFERHSVGRVVEGAPIRVWSFRDVTARFAAEAALRDSELRYRLLFEQSAAGVCVMDATSRITDCNATFASLLGYQRHELAGTRMRELYMRPVEHDELMILLVDALNLNSVEVELRKKDGTPIWLLQNLVIVGEQQSAVVHATFVDISDRKRSEEQIEFHAYHDVLTHLPNRKLFADRLRQSLTHARRYGKPLAVMFIDIDHFKSINDTLGHTSGDELLLEMSYRLRRCVREEDTVARLGGDEFTIILSELRHPEDAANVAQKILRAVQVPLSIGGMPVEVSASLGIALYPVDGTDPESLLRNADSAMYRAKEAGRNTYQLCTEQMKLRAMDRLSLEARLRRAVTDGQLLLHYQPQVSLLTSRIVAVEALLRWNDPDRGLVEPADFVQIAEESRLMVPIGEWVLRTACADMKDWQNRGIAPARVAVNLSARQFQQHDLVESVQKALDSAGLPGHALELEVTETTAMQNPDASAAVMRELRTLGVAIAIDDFGTGYSSLHHLKRLPISAVKIDRAFVANLPNNDHDAAIVSAVLGIARSLRLRVVAEGVETSEQFAFLRRSECAEGQGFYFSHPCSADEMTRMLSGTQILSKQARLSL